MDPWRECDDECGAGAAPTPGDGDAGGGTGRRTITLLPRMRPTVGADGCCRGDVGDVDAESAAVPGTAGGMRIGDGATVPAGTLAGGSGGGG